MWPDRRIIDLFKTEFPIVLAPMAGAIDHELVIAAAQGGADRGDDVVDREAEML